MTNKVYLKSEQHNIQVRKAGAISFNFKIDTEPVEVDKEVADFLVKSNPDNFSIVGEGIEAFDEKEKFKDELTLIKGVGKKTAEDIVKVYPDKNALVEVIKNEGNLPFDDDVSESLQKQYGGD